MLTGPEFNGGQDAGKEGRAIPDGESLFGSPQADDGGQSSSVPLFKAEPAGWSGNGSSLAHRCEQKYEVGIASAAFLCEEISRSLPSFEYHKGFPHTFVTTVYFDTTDYAFYRRAERSYDNNVKIRVKEYYYRGRKGEYLTVPHCYLELKQRYQGFVYKKRLQLPKKYLRHVLHGEDVWELLERQSSGQLSRRGWNGSRTVELPLEDVRQAYRHLRAHLRNYKIIAASVVNYRRSVFQKDEDELRVTFDDQIAIYQAPPGLYSAVEALTCEVLGEPTSRYDKVILEIKCPSRHYPGWLQRALRNHSSKKLSKFTTSVRFLRRLREPSDTENESALRLRGGEQTASDATADSSSRTPVGEAHPMDETHRMTEPFEL